jgi:hypothetical protein
MFHQDICRRLVKGASGIPIVLPGTSHRQEIIGSFAAEHRPVRGLSGIDLDARG